MTVVMQKSFHAGEWSPTLNARVDLAKYHSAAAVMRNFFVDYRGGCSSRTGSVYVLQAYDSTHTVRLIGFQASFTTGYILEFGQNYLRFFFDGAPVLEAATTITGISKANPAVVTVANTYVVGDWVYISGVAGMTQVNGRYFRVNARAAGNVTLGAILDNVNIDSTAYSTYTSGGTMQRVYTLPTPYAASDLALLKFAGNINKLVLTHPSYAPYALTLISANNWTLAVIAFGTTISAPTNLVATTSGAGTVQYSYVVTAVDVNGQESLASSVASSTVDGTGRTIALTWTAVSGAVSYNLYRAGPSYSGAVPSGSAFGYFMNVTGVAFNDSILPTSVLSVFPSDFSETPQITRNPFQGAGVASIAVTAAGVYTTVPALTVGAAPVGGHTATAFAVMQVQGTPTVSSSQPGFVVGDTIWGPSGVITIVASVDIFGAIVTVQPVTNPGCSPGSYIGTGTSTPTSPSSFAKPGTSTPTAQLNLVWGVGAASVSSPGDGYTSAPAVTPSAGAATFTSTLGTAASGYPAVPVFFQQRLVLAGPTSNPHQFNMSTTGNYYNFNTSYPLQADDAIQGTLVATKLNSIKAMLPMPTGLIVLSDQQAWVISGGGQNAPVTPSSIIANSHSYNGANDVPPIVANADVLYIQAKGSVVRNLTFNFYTNIFTGTDISVLSSHLFYGYNITEWAWAEEPFKIAWAVRDDGTLLSLTFLKEQELIGWARHDTEGDFLSIASVTEQVDTGAVDATYVVVERTVNEAQVKFIERFAERVFTDGYDDYVGVDSAMVYNNPELLVSSFVGAEHLGGLEVTGLADGNVITPFVMPASGFFTLASPVGNLAIGLAFTPQLQTLALDTGEPTIQSKTKKITGVTVRVADTLGLEIGQDFDSLVPMKDLVVGEVSGMLTGQASQLVTGLVTGDAYTIINPTWTVPGQYCIQQSSPFPATILGVIPQITVGDV